MLKETSKNSTLYGWVDRNFPASHLRQPLHSQTEGLAHETLKFTKLNFGLIIKTAKNDFCLPYTVRLSQLWS